MKVGKKALSCLLAIIMIVSSCSVCFSVLGATTDAMNVYNAISMHYDSLMQAIDKATKGDESKRDTSGVPVRDGSTWEVKRDTLNGGWLAVSRAVAQYAKVILANDSYSAYHALVKEMLNYGGFAQIYFEYNDENPVNTDLEGVGAEEVPADAAAEMEFSGKVDGISKEELEELRVLLKEGSL